MKLGRTCVTLMILVLGAIGSLAAQGLPANNSMPAQTTSKRLGAAAIAPEDHASLASYFHDLASQELALAKSYDRLARIYKEKTPPPGLDPDSARELKQQYKRLAETERRAAAAAANIAAYHDHLAEMPTSSALAAERTTPGDISAFRR